MPVPQVFRAVRRGTAPLNVFDLDEVAGHFAGFGALARRRSRQLARPERAVQPLRVARGINGGSLRSACIGGCKGTFTSTSSCTTRYSLIRFQPNADRTCAPPMPVFLQLVFGGSAGCASPSTRRKRAVSNSPTPHP